MSMRTFIHVEPNLLTAVVTGKFLLKEAQTSFIEVLEAIAQHRLNKVLFDGRELIGRPQTMERFYYSKFAANSLKAYMPRGVAQTTAFAYVLTPAVLDPHRFGETVAVNRGMNVKVFDNVEEAYEWLKVKPARHTQRNSA